MHTEPAEKYAPALRLLHWLMAVMILGLLAVGLIMAGMNKADPWRGTLYGLHKSFGVTVLMLAVLRVALRLGFGAPALPPAIPALQRMLAQLGHLALYGFMFLLPVSGYVMSTSYGLTVKWFGVALPKLLSVDKARGALAASVHEYAAYALMALLALHVGAVIEHYVRHRINLLRRMV